MSVQQIVEQCQQGNREAFGLLYTAMQERLRKVCRRYVANEAAAADLLHDAFLLIFSKIGTLRNTAKAEQWMMTVTKNLSLMYLKQHKQETMVSLDTMQRQMSVTDAPVAQDSLLTSGVDELPLTYDELMRLVESLPQSYRNVFRLSVLEGLSHQQIAALLNIEPNTSSSQLFRAKRILRQALSVLIIVALLLVLPLAYLWRENLTSTTHHPSPTINGSGGGSPSAAVATVGDSSRVVASTATPFRGHSAPTAVEREPLHGSAVPQAQGDSVRVAVAATREDSREKTVESSPLDSQEYGDSRTLVQTEDQQERTLEECPNTQQLPSSPTTHHPSPDRWLLAMSYSGMGGNGSPHLPFATDETNAEVQADEARHHLPLTIGLSVSYALTSNTHHPSPNTWLLTTGLQYMRMTSDLATGNTYASFTRQQRVQYLGIPLTLTWQKPLSWLQSTGGRSRLSVYGSVGMGMHLPLRSTVEGNYLVESHAVEPYSERLHPGVMWSAGVCVGLQYHVTPAVSFFVEPSLQHYFHKDNGVDTWLTEHPAALTVPLGIRIKVNFPIKREP